MKVLEWSHAHAPCLWALVQHSTSVRPAVVFRDSHRWRWGATDNSLAYEDSCQLDELRIEFLRDKRTNAAKALVEEHLQGEHVTQKNLKDFVEGAKELLL